MRAVWEEFTLESTHTHYELNQQKPTCLRYTHQGSIHSGLSDEQQKLKQGVQRMGV